MKKFLVLLSVLSSLLLISCTNTIDYTEDLYSGDKTKNTLSIYVNSTGSGISFNKTSRMITPNALYSDDLDFYLWGKNETTKTTLERTQVSFEAYNGSSTTGALDLFLAPGVYELTLVAIKKGLSYNTAAILYKAYAQTDLRYNNVVYFCLTSENLTSNGNAQLSLYTVGWQPEENYTVTAGIYDLSNQNTALCKISNFNLRNYYYSTKSEVPENPTYNFNTKTIGGGVSIPSGIYNFTVTINDGYKNYYYTDTIQIHGDRTTIGKIAVPDIVDKKPDSPTYLIAQYELPKNSRDQFYNVEFCWDDNSNVEANFQLEFLIIDDYLENNYSTYISTLTDPSESTVNKTTAWNTIYAAENTYCSDKPFTVDPELFEIPSVSQYLEGSLSRNSTYCVYNLLLGKRYLARICAAADAGKSDYAYLDLPNNSAKTFEGTTSISSPENWNSQNKYINLFRINYQLNGGVFYDDSSNLNVSSQIKKYNFYAQTSTGISVINPVSYEYSTGKYASLKNSSNLFAEWKENSISGASYNLSSNYTSYKNLELYADFNITSEIKYKLIANNNIILGKSNNQQSSEAISNPILLNSFNKTSISLSETTYLYLIVKNAYSDDELNSGSIIYDEVFNNVTFSVSEQGNKTFINEVSSQKENVAPYQYNYYALDLIDTTKFQAGKTYNATYNCYANGELYSTTVIFTLTE